MVLNRNKCKVIVYDDKTRYIKVRRTILIPYPINEKTSEVIGGKLLYLDEKYLIIKLFER